jgi:hypothetical protein
MAQYISAFVPIGQLAITAAGTTTLLSANCGTYGGQTAAPGTTAWTPGAAWRGMEIQADPANSGNLFLLPRGKTASANPGSIIAKIGPGGSLPFPAVAMSGIGFTPENFCLDMDGTGTQYAYGYGILGLG